MLLYVLTTFCSFIPLLRDSWFASPFWLLWINLLYEDMDVHLFEDWHHFFLGYIPRSGITPKSYSWKYGWTWHAVEARCKRGWRPKCAWKATYHRFTYWIRVLLRIGLGISIFNKYCHDLMTNWVWGVTELMLCHLLPIGILWNLWMLSLQMEHGIWRGIINSHKRKEWVNQIIFNRVILFPGETKVPKPHLKHIVRSLPLPCKLMIW